MQVKEKIIEKAFLVIALSSISILALITFFIFEEGLPLIWKIGPKAFLLGERWIPSQGFVRHLSDDRQFLLGHSWGPPSGYSSWVGLYHLSCRNGPLLPWEHVLRPAIQLLAAIPSVIYGFWGLIVLVPLVRNYLGGPGLSILSGSLILGFMILPTIISISEDSLRALPPTYKAGALALGATHWQTIWRVLIPAARSGIVASIILGMGRAIGETMAMIMILGNAVKMPTSFLDSARTLTTNIGIEMGYASGDHRQALFATGIVLFFIIMVLNSLAIFLSRRRVRLMINRTRYLTQSIAKILIWIAALSTIAVMILILFQILKEGFPVLHLRFFLDSPKSMGREGGIFSTIIGTMALTVVAILFAAPLGVGTAIFLREYTRESRISRLIRFGTDCLAGVPSIIFGLFGFVFFVIRLNMGWSILSGGLTLAAMILPTVISTTEESIKAIPHSYREVSYSLGGTKWQTVTRVVLPNALPGIFTGIITECGKEHWRDCCRHSDRGLLFGDAHFPLLSHSNHVRPFLYPRQRGDFHGDGLRNRSGFDLARLVGQCGRELVAQPVYPSSDLKEFYVSRE